MPKMGSYDPFEYLKHNVQHTIIKILARATISIQTSSQSKVCTQSYGHPKSRESQFWEFQDSHLEVPLGSLGTK